MTDTILQGDVRSCLKQLEDGSAQCCITSPPYWGLRDYGCDGQIGLEPTPEAYVADLVDVFREVKRVLREDGVLWLNLGDSYWGANWRGSEAEGTMQATNRGASGAQHSLDSWNKDNKHEHPYLKPKDLCMIPARVAIALQMDGWWLRNDIIWSKPNPMPESVTDRCTKSHEYIFMLTKSERYFYDSEAVKEPIAESTAEDPRLTREGYDVGRPERGFPGGNSRGSGLLVPKGDTGKRNKRDVWTVATQPCSEAHFATFPPKLIEPMILAGSKVGDTILDPFMGSGTTAIQAVRLHRHYLGCELNPEYVRMAERRIADMVGPLFAEAA